jgi:hypothetical protein
MTIPAHTDRLHLEPYWLGDSKYAIRVASRKRIGSDGGRFIDCNFQVCLSDDGKSYEAVCLHWGTARKNGYLYITYKTKYGVTRRRKMTRAELDRHISEWKLSDIKRWRRTARAGRSLASRIRPQSFVEMVKYAKRYRVIICAELKSILFAKRPELAAKMKAQVKAINHTTYVMTLVTMTGWRYKMRNFHNAGFETALLAHGARRPADLTQWRPVIDRIWGGFR